MLDLLFSGGALWFTVPAILGTAVFILRLGLMFIGGHLGNLDASIDAHDMGHTHQDGTEAFQWLSFQSIAAFVMGFGWAGLAALKGSNWSWPVAVGCAVMGGLLMVYLRAICLKALYDLASSGNIPLSAALGVEGEMYVGIPQSGEAGERPMGKVKLVVNARQRIFNAVSFSGEPLPSHTRVKVTRINEDNTLAVARA